MPEKVPFCPAPEAVQAMVTGTGDDSGTGGVGEAVAAADGATTINEFAAGAVMEKF